MQSTLCHAARVVIGVLLGALAHEAVAQRSGSLLSNVFADHVVLQRGSDIRVWGTALPGEAISVDFGGSVVSGTTDTAGAWSISLPAMQAGGPFDMIVISSSGAVQTVSDVLVGDVYLCTGQSNMVLQVSRSTMGQFEAMRANDGRIRMTTIANASDPVPLDDFAEPLKWEVASPETVPAWSAACYYFARDLRSGPLAGDDVPVGLITAAWGGSSITSWMDRKALTDVGRYDDALETLRLYTTDYPAAQRRFGTGWEDWWIGETGVDRDRAEWQPHTGSAWSPAPEGLGDWTRWEGLEGFTGLVWFRGTVELTGEQASGAAELHLGGVDEVDQTWMNGSIVGNTFGFGTPRVYDVMAAQLKPGENVLVTSVLNTWASGGLTGDHALRGIRLHDGTWLPFEDWRYVPVRHTSAWPPRAPWESVRGLSTIHNAMIAPLGAFGLSGVLWYQGESDTDFATDYERAMKALIAQWRRQFEAPDLMALVVQLPNFGALPTVPSESGWAYVREAQRTATLGDAHAATIVTLDVGDPRDLHPPNKQAIGSRLARAARSIRYGSREAVDVPYPVSARRDGSSVRVEFAGVTDALVVYGGPGPIGFEVCGDAIGSCRYVEARADGTEVHLRVEDGEQVSRVRYAWADSPIVTLYDGSGLPVGPFETAVEQP